MRLSALEGGKPLLSLGGASECRPIPKNKSTNLLVAHPASKRELPLFGSSPVQEIIELILFSRCCEVTPIE